MKFLFKLLGITFAILLFATTFGMGFAVFAILLGAHNQEKVTFFGWAAGLVFLFIGVTAWKDFGRILGFAEFQKDSQEGDQ
jgi:hypothetical protein